MAGYPVLNRNGDFVRLYKRGKSQVHPLLVTYLMKNRKKGETRVGITATKKVGGAVQRNRAKRIIRAAWQELRPLVPRDYDLVFVARSRTCQCGMLQLRRVMEQHLQKLLPTPPPAGTP